MGCWSVRGIWRAAFFVCFRVVGGAWCGGKGRGADCLCTALHQQFEISFEREQTDLREQKHHLHSRLVTVQKELICVVDMQQTMQQHQQRMQQQAAYAVSSHLGHPKVTLAAVVQALLALAA